MRKSWAGALAVLIASLPLAGCVVIPVGPVVTSDDVPAPVAASSPATRSVESTRPAAAGSQLAAGRLYVTVQARRERSAFGRKAAPTREYVLVDVELRNRGWGTYDLRPGDFTMRDRAGRALSPLPTDGVSYNAQSGRPLSPGLGATTTFVYEIRRLSAGYVFAYRPDGQKKTLRWLVP